MRTRIGVCLPENWSPSEGGSASYLDKLIKEIDSFNFHESIEIYFINFSNRVFSFKKPSIELPSFPVFSAKETPAWQKGIYKIPFLGFRAKQLKSRSLEYYYHNAMRLQLKSRGIKFLFYPVQMYLPVEDFPFVAVNWDVGHLSTASFPEITYINSQFKKRNYFYREVLPSALSILAESEAGRTELISYLNLNRSKVKVMPLFTGGVVDVTLKPDDEISVLASFGLIANRFFLYPAQFWAHKNHYHLLLAFATFIGKHPGFRLILTGSDQGNLNYVKELIARYGLSDSIVMPGFVENNVLASLYRNAAALVMPTFLGPTNMPLLEALHFGCPVICSDMEGHREMLQDAAIFIDPYDPAAIACAMEKIVDPGFSAELRGRMDHLRPNSPFNVKHSLAALDNCFTEVSGITNCWE